MPHGNCAASACYASVYPKQVARALKRGKVTRSQLLVMSGIARHESPAYIPTDPGRVASLLTSRHDLLAPFMSMRANDAAPVIRSPVLHACCAMIGAAAESIVLAAGVQKLTEPAALKLYHGTHGRKSLQRKRYFANCPEYVAKEFRLHAGLIDLFWRDQSSHASPS